ncbi:MAG: tRNA (5-methylaminomethyl-2-thiouridine)(34)-methyltransferase MnmD [Pseudomonadota bacterium]
MPDGKTEEAVIFDQDGLLFAPRFEDHYFSRHDGRAETEHVFMGGNNLPHRWSAMEGAEFTIGELGFGTGLNFLVPWDKWRKHGPKTGHLNFVSLEGFPISAEQARQALSVWPDLQPLVDHLVQGWPFVEGQSCITRHWPKERISLTIHHGMAVDVIEEFPIVEAWFLDGFAPARNGSMWTGELMAKVFKHTRPGGTFASYTAAGQVRRDLSAAGFTVERQPGFGHKRHMIAGHKPSDGAAS